MRLPTGKPVQRAAQAILRFVAFGITTAYGLHPARALVTIAVLWALLIPVYSWAVWRTPDRSAAYSQPGVQPQQGAGEPSGIYRIWPANHIEFVDNVVRVVPSPRAERLQGQGWSAAGWGTYFSLLSAFHVGFREFNVGTWIVQLQQFDYGLTAAGWVRTVSGVQSLLSLYLLAVWALTSFGRPFE